MFVWDFLYLLMSWYNEDWLELKNGWSDVQCWPWALIILTLLCCKNSEIPHYHIFCNVLWQIEKLATFWQKEKFCLQIWYLFLFLQLFTMLSSFHPEFLNHGNFFWTYRLFHYLGKHYALNTLKFYWNLLVINFETPFIFGFGISPN